VPCWVLDPVIKWDEAFVYKWRDGKNGLFIRLFLRVLSWHCWTPSGGLNITVKYEHTEDEEKLENRRER